MTYSFGAGTFQGRPTFCVDWVNVSYFADSSGSKLNSFQLLLVDRADRGAGDFDIIFNYDKVQWETGNASGGSGGLGGSSARIGYSNGSSSSFEMPGSGVNGAFLDTNTTGGLIHHGLNSSQLGRYIFSITNGASPGTSSVSGTVFQNSVGTGNALPGAFVQACSASGFCGTTVSGSDGRYTISGLNGGAYNLHASPPSGSNLRPADIIGLNIADGASITDADLVLEGPQPLPNGTTITSRSVSPSGVPTVFWNEPLTMVTHSCPGGTASYTVIQDGVVVRSGGMTEGPAGTYTTVIAAFYPIHGDVDIRIAVDCPSGPDDVIEFTIYIDPSGTVQDTSGATLPNATVTLFRSDSGLAGTFTQVPNGSNLMDPGNRNNPDVTDASGHFGWDVVAGFYIVRAELAGCHAPGNPAQSFIESAVLTIPPPVTDLNLQLECAAGPTNTDPVVDAGPDVTTTGALSQSGSFTDPDADTWTATVDYGDGSGTQALALSGKNFTLNHTYTAPGTATVTVTVDDGAGGVGTDTLLVTVQQPQTDVTAPSCRLTGTGTNSSGQKYIAITAQDAGSGIASIVVTRSTNSDTTVVPFIVGTTNPVVITGTKINQSKSSQVALTVTDVAGNVTDCDPVDQTIVRDTGRPQIAVLTGIPQAEGVLTIQNGSPGFQRMLILVNNRPFTVNGLRNGETRDINISTAMRPGEHNTVMIVPVGRRGASAYVIVWDGVR